MKDTEAEELKKALHKTVKVFFTNRRIDHNPEDVTHTIKKATEQLIEEIDVTFVKEVIFIKEGEGEVQPEKKTSNQSTTQKRKASPIQKPKLIQSKQRKYENNKIRAAEAVVVTPTIGTAGRAKKGTRTTVYNTYKIDDFLEDFQQQPPGNLEELKGICECWVTVDRNKLRGLRFVESVIRIIQNQVPSLVKNFDRFPIGSLAVCGSGGNQSLREVIDIEKHQIPKEEFKKLLKQISQLVIVDFDVKLKKGFVYLQCIELFGISIADALEKKTITSLCRIIQETLVQMNYYPEAIESIVQGLNQSLVQGPKIPALLLMLEGLIPVQDLCKLRWDSIDTDNTSLRMIREV